MRPLKLIFFVAASPAPGPLWLVRELAGMRGVILDGVVVASGRCCSGHRKSLLKRGIYRFPGYWAERGPDLPIRQAVRAVEQAFTADYPARAVTPASWVAWCQDFGIACDCLDADSPRSIGRELARRQPDLGIVLADGWSETSLLQVPHLGSLQVYGGPLLPGRIAWQPGLLELLTAREHILLTLRWWGSPERAAGEIAAQRLLAIEPCATLESLAILGTQSSLLLIREWMQNFCANQAGLIGRAPLTLPGGRGHSFHPDPQAGFANIFSGRVARQRRQRILEMPRYRHHASEERSGAILQESAQYLQSRQAGQEHLAHRIAVGDAPIVVLYYHRTANDHGHGITLPLEEFVRQITFIHQHAEVISLDMAVRRLASGHNSRLAVAITIDDGYASDLITALPWLEMHGHPATLFISPGLMLERATPLGFDLLTADDVRTLRRRGFGIGSHTMWHADLGQNTGPQVDFELQRSREILEEILDEPVHHFAFPFGVHGKNITREAFLKARSVYRYLYSAYGGYNFPSRFDGVHVRRFPTPNSVLEVARLLAGLVPTWMDPEQKIPWDTPTNFIPPF
ncbi:MAG: polysaccharide deacetylase family protein [Magnetococcus sp. DMHC-1]|nr:polysaccharide deacetylase family protein [Magnetococcales bacterium]